MIELSPFPAAQRASHTDAWQYRAMVGTAIADGAGAALMGEAVGTRPHYTDDVLALAWLTGYRETMRAIIDRNIEARRCQCTQPA